MEVDWWQLQASVIAEVKKYPCLYNSNRISRWNARRRAPYWEAVAAAINVHNVTEADCRRIWRGLRDKYVREIRLGSTRNVDGTLLSARSQWPFLRRLDFLREHIRPKRLRRLTGTALQGEEADSIDNNESTSNDVLARGFVSHSHSFFIFASALCPLPRLHKNKKNDSMDEGEAGAPPSPAPISKPPKSGRRKSGLQRRGTDGSSTRGRRKRGRSTSGIASRSERGKAPLPASLTDWVQQCRRGRPPKGLRLLRRWKSPAEGSSSSDEENDGEEGVGKYEVDDEQRDSEDAKRERREAAIEVALYRFVTTVVSKVASSSTAVGEPLSVKRELRVDAGDGDTLFLLGLRGLMCNLDAQSKSQAQIDILKLLQDRIADAESRRPESCDEVDEQAKQTVTTAL
ncbi:hypothetical protein HPB51_019310 [Rhipicephalus microplus]|uniref:MADF domain-containing protein n=1 Tax=Rhipicephalus microplus TaxID=6941 RepID=A0A9J6EUD2_RHIMP|nr:hypothetical protein HPB51_019310 [Rhipicephalus microplus]